MSWIEKLYKTYEACAGAPQFESDPLLPVSHTEQQAHVEIVLDATGNFQRAELVQKETTVVPATEKSAGRVGTRPPPHPLCDKVQYCAADYAAFGGRKEPFFKEYVEQLRTWVRAQPNPKVQAVLSYVERGELIRDLIGQKILHCSDDGKLLTQWPRETPAPGIFKLLTAKEGERDQGDVFIRWRVQIAGDPGPSAVWRDQEVRDAWARFDAMQTSEGGVEGLCYVTGDITLLASSHPKRIRHGADGAKLISSNDADGFTFRGRFARPDQAYGAGILVTQKAHNALRWLVARQGYHDKSSGQVFVSWAISGKKIPDPLENTARLLGIEQEEAEGSTVETGDAGQHFAKRLSKAISGYKAIINDLEEIVILGLDSATPGRMAITCYRELAGAEFLDRLYGWHNGCAWFQRYSSNLSFIGAPAPSDIAECAYGRRLDDKLRKATVERFLPCIIDARPIPRDVLESCIRRVSNRVAFKKKDQWEWEKCLGVACALFRGSRKEEHYKMALEEDRTSRDYLFGRLLAIADNVESLALHLAKESRDTNAAKLMQRFADHPCSTWRNIELSLSPYKTRLRASRPGALFTREKLLDAVICMFKPGDFTSDGKLTGEFLLGYHCQRAALQPKGATEQISKGEVEEAQGDEDL
jgi:CRISPR-associated protein Csd1